MKRACVGVFKWLQVAILCALPGCSSEPSTNGEQVLEIYSFWTNPGESDALLALTNLYTSKHPRTTIINAAVTGNVNAHDQLRARMLAGSPPDTFQVLGGGDLFQWVVYNGIDASESKMEPVDSVAQTNGLAAVTPAAILDQVSYAGKMYSIPIASHRYNTLFFNAKLLAANGLTPPTTLAEFYQAADVLKANGIVPLALGNKLGWPVTLIGWDGVLVAQAGAEFRNSYMAGHESPNDPRVVSMLDELVKILGYTNEDRDLLSWDEAAQKVVDGTAAMTIMGDWAKGYFLSHGMQPNVDFGSLPAPGTAGVFVYNVDSFGLPLGASDRAATLDFLNLVASPEAQNLFNPIKGSTPPRTDADLSFYDVLAQRTLLDFQSSQLILAREIAITNPAFNAELVDTMQVFAADRNVDNVVHMLENRYDLLF